MSKMQAVIIGVDPHKMSVTIEVVDSRERLLGTGRFATDRVYALTWAVGIACVGAAGVLLAPIYAVYPTAGLQFVLIAYVAVVGNLLELGENNRFRFETDAFSAALLGLAIDAALRWRRGREAPAAGMSSS